MKKPYKVEFHIKNTKATILKNMERYEITSIAFDTFIKSIKKIPPQQQWNFISAFNVEQANKLLLYIIFKTKFNNTISNKQLDEQFNIFFFKSIFDQKPILVLGGGDNSETILWNGISITIKKDFENVINKCINYYNRIQLSPDSLIKNIKSLISDTKQINKFNSQSPEL